jgi:glycosyltransferase involved in cell wall biosynthesis
MSKLIIGVDIRDLRIAKTGTKTYLEELCKEFRNFENEQYGFHFFDTPIPVYTGENKLLKLIEHLRYQFWKQISLPIKAWSKACDILFCTDNVVPYIHLGYETVPVFHDAFFFENPDHYNPIWLWLLKNTALPAARRSMAVITPTSYAKKRIIHFTGLPAEKLTTIYEGPKTFPQVTDEGAENLLLQLNLENKKYLLHVGVMSKRKNIPALIRAFYLLKRSGYTELKLVLTGNTVSKKHSDDYQEIQNTITKYALEQEVIFTGYLNDQELGHIYNQAMLYVFPSVNEGFGIPLLEAFHHRIPVLVANNTCLPEVGGNAVIPFDPFCDEDMFEKLKMVIDDPELQQKLIGKGEERLKMFSWNNTARELLRVFEPGRKKH